MEEAAGSEFAGLVTAGAEEVGARHTASAVARRAARLPDLGQYSSQRSRGFPRYRKEPHRAERRVARGAADVGRPAVARGNRLAPGDYCYNLTAGTAGE